jgi:hypothetical protein
MDYGALIAVLSLVLTAIGLAMHYQSAMGSAKARRLNSIEKE